MRFDLIGKRHPLSTTDFLYNQIIKQANASGVAVNNTANVRIPPSGIHFGLYLDCRNSSGVAITVANIISSITNLILRYDGVEIMNMTAQFAFDYQKYYMDSMTGAAANVAGLLPIFLAPPYYTTYRERAAVAVGTDGMGSITLDIVLGANIQSISTIAVYSELYPDKAPLTQFTKIRKFPRTFTQTGNFVISDLPLENATVGTKCFHVNNGSNAGVMDYGTIKVGNFAIWDTIYVNLETVLANMTGRTPQSAYYHFDFGRNNDLSSYLPMGGISDLQILTDWTTAPNNFIIYAEQVAGLIVK